MRTRSKISDYSPLFDGLLSSSVRLRIEERQEDGRTIAVLMLFGAEVRGGRQALEKVRDGLLRNGGPRRMFI